MHIFWIVIGVLNLCACALLLLHSIGYVVIEDRRDESLSLENWRKALMIFNREVVYASRFNNRMREIVFCLPFKTYLNFTTYMTGPEVLIDGTLKHNKFSVGADFFKSGLHMLEMFTIFDIRFGWDRYYSIDLAWKRRNELLYPEWCVRRIKI